MTQTDSLAVSHVTLRVADLARSEAFYAALGFERLYAAAPEAAFLQLLEIAETAVLQMVAMQGPGLRIELLAAEARAMAAPPGAAPTRGLRHIALRTADLDRTAARILAAGGAVHSETRVSVAAGDFVMATDPDGARLLLMQAAAQKEAPE